MSQQMDARMSIGKAGILWMLAVIIVSRSTCDLEILATSGDKNFMYVADGFLCVYR